VKKNKQGSKPKNTAPKSLSGRSISLEEFASLASVAPIGVYILENKRFCYVNPKSEEITGYSRDEMLAANSLSFVHPDDRERVHSSAVKALKGNVCPYEYCIITRSGEPRYILEIVTPYIFNGMKAAIGYFMDITERQTAERLLRESEEFNASLLANTPFPILVINRDKAISFVNPALEALTGYTAEELIGLSLPYPWWHQNAHQEMPDIFAELDGRDKITIQHICQSTAVQDSANCRKHY
jgi:PAS domain S-box-containing protein